MACNGVNRTISRPAILADQMLSLFDVLHRSFPRVLFEIEFRGSRGTEEPRLSQQVVCRASGGGGLGRGLRRRPSDRLNEAGFARVSETDGVVPVQGIASVPRARHAGWLRARFKHEWIVERFVEGEQIDPVELQET